MQAFTWNPRFETGIPVVDDQHRQLVDIVNRLGEVLIGTRSAGASLQGMFGDLAGYARHHFADEERLMAEAGVHPAHVEPHRDHHRQFVEQLQRMWQGRGVLERPAEVLHGFLTSWLTSHILEEDQAMARQLALRGAGAPAGEALAEARREVDNGSAVLLEAMRKLYQVLAIQNEDLAAANARLEAMVVERTRALVLAERMAAVGQLAAGVAHQLNSPLGCVQSNLGTLRGYADRLLRVVGAAEACLAPHAAGAAALARVRAEVELDYLREDLPALLRESQDAMGRVNRIVQSLEGYSRAGGATARDADLLEVLEHALALFREALGPEVLVVRELRPLPPVRCVPSQLSQVFMAALANASRAIAGAGRITLRSGSDAEGVWVEIADDGCGMDPAVRARIFDPFLAAAPGGQAAGMGLPLSWEIVVRQHGGRIDVWSEPGQGTRLTFWLPRRPAA